VGRNAGLSERQISTASAIAKIPEAAFVKSANRYRRHITKSQLAMTEAIIDQVGHQGQRTDLGTECPEVNSEYMRKLISKARKVFRYEPALAHKVLIGAQSPNSADRPSRGRHPGL
jgi:hypothetical protein